MNALPQSVTPAAIDDPLTIAGRSYRSRLLTGTGKFKDLAETQRATEAAGAQIVTVAIRGADGMNGSRPTFAETALRKPSSSGHASAPGPRV